MPSEAAVREPRRVDEVAEDAARVFRLDNEHLAFRYTATLSDRAAASSFERLSSPERLTLWLSANDLDPRRDATHDDLANAVALREAIYRLGVATATGSPRRAGDVALINAAAAAPAAPELTDAGMVWRVAAAEDSIRAGLAVVAQDAIRVFGGEDAERIKTCDGVDCAGLYLDTSRGNNRRWCSMNTCGNKNKKTRMRAHS